MRDNYVAETYKILLLLNQTKEVIPYFTKQPDFVWNTVKAHLLLLSHLMKDHMLEINEFENSLKEELNNIHQFMEGKRTSFENLLRAAIPEESGMEAWEVVLAPVRNKIFVTLWFNSCKKIINQLF